MFSFIELTTVLLSTFSFSSAFNSFISTMFSVYCFISFEFKFSNDVWVLFLISSIVVISCWIILSIKFWALESSLVFFLSAYKSFKLLRDVEYTFLSSIGIRVKIALSLAALPFFATSPKPDIVPPIKPPTIKASLNLYFIWLKLGISLPSKVKLSK